MKNERDVKAEVKRILSAMPECWWFMPVMNGYGQQGIPDFVGCISGHFFAIETKFGKNKMSDWQVIQRDRIHKTGGLYLLITEETTIELDAILRAIVEVRES